MKIFSVIMYEIELLLWAVYYQTDNQYFLYMLYIKITAFGN